MASRSTCKNCVFLTKRPGLFVTRLVCAAPAKNNAVVREDDLACPEFMGQFAQPGLGIFKSSGKGEGRAPVRKARQGVARPGARAGYRADALAADGVAASPDDLDLEALEARAAAAEARAQALEAQAAAAEARAARAHARQESARQETGSRPVRPARSPHANPSRGTAGRGAPRHTSQGVPRASRPSHGRSRRPEGE